MSGLGGGWVGGGGWRKGKGEGGCVFGVVAVVHVRQDCVGLFVCQWLW